MGKIECEYFHKSLFPFWLGLKPILSQGLGLFFSLSEPSHHLDWTKPNLSVFDHIVFPLFLFFNVWFTVCHMCTFFCSFAKLCLTLDDPVGCSPPGSFVHGISQARILEWVAIPFSTIYFWKVINLKKFFKPEVFKMGVVHIKRFFWECWCLEPAGLRENFKPPKPSKKDKREKY